MTSYASRVVRWRVRNGSPLPGSTPSELVSQLAHRVFGPIRRDRVQALLDYHGLAGVPAENQAAVARHHRITPRTLTGWSMTLTAAGRRLPLSIAVAAEAARRSRPGDDHLARTRVARRLGLTIPPPAITPSPPDPPTSAMRAAAAIAIRVLATAGPLPMTALYAAVRRSRRFATLPPMTAEQLAMALTGAGATADQGTLAGARRRHRPRPRPRPGRDRGRSGPDPSGNGRRAGRRDVRAITQDQQPSAHQTHRSGSVPRDRPAAFVRPHQAALRYAGRAANSANGKAVPRLPLRPAPSTPTPRSSPGT